RAFLALCDRAGVRVRIPDEINQLCCGTPWKSKGMTDGQAAMAERVAQALWTATEQGRLPVVVDAASCTEGVREVQAGHPIGSGLDFVDAVAFVREHVLDRLSVRSTTPSLVLHPTCASTRLATDDD